MVALTPNLDVSRETIDDLKKFQEELEKWNRSINLVSRSTLTNPWERHIIDSAQIWISDPEINVWTDVGSGGGLPGMVVAILARELNPSMIVNLVESDSRKSAFLRSASVKLNVNTKVYSQRIEEIDPLSSQVISARALAPLVRLIELTKVHLSDGGRMVFLKGSDHKAEIAAASEAFDFTLEAKPSFTNPEARILTITNLATKQ